MTTFDKLKSLKAVLAKEHADLKKKHTAAKAVYEKLTAELQAYEAELGIKTVTGPDVPMVLQPSIKAILKAASASSVPAGVRLKKDGTPKKKPGPQKQASPKAESPKKVVLASAPEGVRLKKDGTPKKKPGPQKKMDVVAPTAKPAKAVKAVKAAAPKADSNQKAGKTQKNRAAEGRRAVLAGERPNLKDAMKQVMTSKTMNSQAIYDLLKEKGWLPNAKDPKGYIGYSLSSLKDDFERVADKGRGFYRVRGSASNGKSEKLAPKADQVLLDAAEILGVN